MSEENTVDTENAVENFEVMDVEIEVIDANMEAAEDAAFYRCSTSSCTTC